jgi:hypothetical protein
MIHIKIKPIIILIGTKGSTGVNKLATVDELKKELMTLTKKSKSPKIKSKSPKIKSKKSPIESKSAEYPKELSQILPDDVLVQTLLHSDINTIVNVCTSSKNKEKLCDAQFWHSKFEIDNLPIIEKSKNFNDWVKQYSTLIDAKIQAEQMTHIILSFNKYKGDSVIHVWYDIGKNISSNVLNYVEVKGHYLKQTICIEIMYNRKSNIWTISNEEEPDKFNISFQNVISILIIEIYNKMMEFSSIDFHDINENELYYPNLLKKAKQNKPIPRAYLSMYELLMSCGK